MRIHSLDFLGSPQFLGMGDNFPLRCCGHPPQRGLSQMMIVQVVFAVLALMSASDVVACQVV